MKKSLILKISLIISVALVIFSLAAGIVTSSNETNLMERELIRLTYLYAEYAKITSPEEVADVSDKDADVRVSVIALDGTVIADSLDVNAHENHLYREEVQNALNGVQDKVIVRYSETARAKLAYYAVKTNVGGVEMLVRVSVPDVNISGFVATTVILFIVSVVAITAITAALVSRTVNGSLKPLTAIKQSLDDIKNGKYKSVMPNERYSEINELIIGINCVADNLSDTIATLGVERKKLEYLTENMSEAVIAVQSDGCVVMSNSNAKTLMNAEEGMYIDMLLCDNELEKTYNDTDINRIQSCGFEREGRYYRFTVCSTPDDGEDIAKIIIISDITDSKIAEIERREFFSNCSHELKTPLAVIKGYAELMANGIVKGDKTKDYSRKIVKDSDKLLNIIDDMLILSRLDENITGTPQIINVKSMASEIICEFDAVYGSDIETELCGDDINVYMANKNAYGLLRNIIENAYKYNIKGGKVKIDILQTENKKAVFSVANSGEGIPEKEISRVTERFYRVEKSRSDKKGSGLGLAIVKHICMLYGIKLKIESSMSEGTIVSLVFPETIIS